VSACQFDINITRASRAIKFFPRTVREGPNWGSDLALRAAKSENKCRVGGWPVAGSKKRNNGPPLFGPSPRRAPLAFRGPEMLLRVACGPRKQQFASTQKGIKNRTWFGCKGTGSSRHYYYFVGPIQWAAAWSLQLAVCSLQAVQFQL